jgi:hypothetical protein
MKIAKIIAIAGLIAMTAVLANGFINGNFSQDGAELLANPWGIVSFVDLYVGFALFSIWIAFREKNLLMMVLGFFTGSLYLLLALIRAKGDWLSFFLGDRKDETLAKIGKA